MAAGDLVLLSSVTSSSFSNSAFTASLPAGSLLHAAVTHILR